MHGFEKANIFFKDDPDDEEPTYAQIVNIFHGGVIFRALDSDSAWGTDLCYVPTYRISAIVSSNS